MGLCGSTPQVKYQDNPSTTPTTATTSSTTSTDATAPPPQKLTKKHSKQPSGRNSIKAALIPHVKLHRNQAITDLYDLSDEKLGEGMTGAVFKAHVKSSGQEVAIKNVRKNLVRDVKALLKEITLLAQCDHPNIVRIIGSAEDRHNVYMALEVCTGGAMLDTLMSSATHHFEEEQVGRMAVMMFRAIEYCHSHGIAHRDLKLDNWLFEKPDGELKLIDFGLSKKFYSGDYDHNGMMRMTSFLGTPGFVAPEMQQTHLGERSEYTTEVDIWSLGVIVFALLSGKMPFKRKPTDCVPLEDKEERAYRRSFTKAPWTTLSDSCVNFVEALLDPNPDTRPNAAAALKHPFLQTHAATLTEKRLHSTLSGKTLLTQEKTALRRMTEFARMDALQKAAMMLIAHELHQDEIDELRTIFYRLDKDNDGEITWREMKEGFLELNSTPPEAVHKLFEHFVEGPRGEEHNDDDVIPYSYFLAATMDHHVLRNIDRLHEAFHSFDPDDTGMVDLHKVMDMLEAHNTKKHGANVSSVGEHLKSLSERSLEGAERSRAGSSQAATKKEPRKSKVNDTSHVTFEEFRAALSNFHEDSTVAFNQELSSVSKKESHKNIFEQKLSSSSE